MKMISLSATVLLALCLATVANAKAEFEGRRIVLLGSSTGMAKEAGKLIVERGGQVVFSSRTQEKLDKLLAEMGNPANAFGIPCDSAEVENIANLLEESNKLMGGIDGFMYGPTCTDPEGFAGLQDVFESGKLMKIHRCQQQYNVEGFLESLRLVTPYMEKSGGGAVVVISSIMAQLPSYTTAYTAAKQTVDSYVRSLSLYLARKYNIRVNSFAAGVHITSIFGDDSGEFVTQETSPRIPMGRPGTAAEGGEVIAFMLSDRASYMNGEVLVSDGGAMNVNAFSTAFMPPQEQYLVPPKADTTEEKEL